MKVLVFTIVTLLIAAYLTVQFYGREAVISDGEKKVERIDKKERPSDFKLEEKEVSSIKKELSLMDKEAMEGVKLLNGGKYSEGLKSLTSLLEKDPKNQIALEELAFYYLEEEKNLDEAEKLLLRLYHASEGNLETLSQLIYVMEQKGEEGKIESFLDQALKKNPESIGANMAMAQFLGRQERLSESIPYWEKLNELQRDGEGLEDLASIYQKNGEFEKSATTYEKVIEMKQKKIKELNQRGEMFDEYQEDLLKTQAHYSIMKMELGDCHQASELISLFQKDQKKEDWQLRLVTQYKEKCK